VSIEVLTIILLVGFMGLLALGLPLAFITGGLGVALAIYLGGVPMLHLVVSRVFNLMGSYTMVAVPMFILMAAMLERSGIAEDLYGALHQWMGPVPGGLASATVLACTVMAAMTGIIGAGVVTMGLVALPAMLHRNYDKKLAMGCIMAGGSLGTLIPPSVVLIVYGLQANVSIGKLFLGGITPGILLSVMFVTYITVIGFLRPHLCPALPKDQRAGSLLQKLAYSKFLLLPGLLIVAVLGSIYLGITSISEASGIGALGAMVCAALHRRLTWRNLKDSLFTTMKISAMVMWLFFGASTFVAAYTRAGGSELIQNLVLGSGLGPWGIVILTQVIFIVLGMFLDWLGILLLAMPLFVPMIVELGFDPIWYGVIFVMNMQMAYLSPPFGGALFYMKGVAPPDIKMSDVIASVWPFLAMQLIGLILVMIFPQIAMWIPRRMGV